MAHLIQSLYNTVLCWLNIKWLKFWVRNRVVAWSPSSHLIPLRLIPQSSKHGFGVPLGYTSEFQTILTLTLTLSAISPSIFHECTMKFPRVYETCVCSVVSNLFVIPWTVAHQALLSMGFPGKNIGVVAISSSRGSSQPRDWTHISCIGQQLLYHCAIWETLYQTHGIAKIDCVSHWKNLSSIKPGMRDTSKYKIWWSFH